MPRGVRIGLKDIYYALLTKDQYDGVGAGVTYAAPVRIAGAMVANVNPNSSTETLFADDGPMESASTLGNIELELGVIDIPLPVLAVLLGHTYANGKLSKKADDVPPWLAVGFRSLKSNGNYRYKWLLKGKFMVPEENHETKGDSVSFQTPTITGNFVARDYDGLWELTGDEDENDFTAQMALDWFLAATIAAWQQGFTLQASTATPDEGVAFNLEITGAVDCAGDEITGATPVEVFSSLGEDLSAITEVVLDAQGDGNIAVTLNTVGQHWLTVKMADMMRVVMVDVQEVI
jgi:phi13 family phage major tail protein